MNSLVRFFLTIDRREKEIFDSIANLTRFKNNVIVTTITSQYIEEIVDFISTYWAATVVNSLLIDAILRFPRVDAKATPYVIGSNDKAVSNFGMAPTTR